jgi:predicted metalloprotease
MTPTQEKHHCTVQNAAKFMEWIATRGGLALWKSINLSNPDISWTSPVLTEDSKPYEKPSWQAANRPYRIITDASEVLVDRPKEVKRFHIAVRRSQGLSLKVSDGGSRRIRHFLAKHHEKDPWYEFDYDTQEAVIYVADGTMPLSEWREGK